jgi:hypothetical protein
LFEGRIIRYGNKEKGCKEGRQKSCQEGDQKSNQEEVVGGRVRGPKRKGLLMQISRPFRLVATFSTSWLPPRRMFG